MFCRIFLLLALCGFAGAQTATDNAVRSQYEAGSRALQAGDLSAARQAFLSILQILPEDVGARVNLAVVCMRQKKWDEALTYLRQAEQRAPEVPGIRLNIGLAEFRKGDYAAAIPPFEKVLREQPDSVQARHLLGLCYLFRERYAEAASTLEPLWPASNNDLTYLYCLAVAAGNAGRHDLEDRAEARLMNVGGESPIVHLLRGKAYLAREDFSHALEELRAAGQGNPNLPLLHYNLGVVYRRQGHLDEARAEFNRDLAIEPDVAYNYDQLGVIAYDLQQDAASEKAFRKALALDAGLGTSWFGLAKVLRQQKREPEALEAINHALGIDPASASAHYLRSQILTALGRRQQAQQDLAAVRRLKDASRDALQQKFERGEYQDPPVLGSLN